MGSKPEPNETAQQATRKKIPTPAAKVGTATTLDTAQGDRDSDYASTSNEVSATKQNSAQRNPLQPVVSHRQFRASSRTPVPSSSQGQESFSWQELPEKVDRLSADMRDIQIVLRELQQDKHEKMILRQRLEEAQEQLKQTTLGFETARKNWKKAASQLDQLRSHETSLYQLPDSELIELARKLRYEIQNFSVQYFVGKPLEKFDNHDTSKLEKYMLDITPGSHDYQDYLLSETKAPMMIQSFLWRFLVGEVSEHFYWFPELSESVASVYQALHPDGESRGDPETQRRFHMWKATTSALIMEYLRDTHDEKAQEEDEWFHRDASKALLKVIGPFIRSSHEEALNDLIYIIKSFIVLDKEICRQAACVYWILPPSQDLVRFNPNYMLVENGEASPQPGQHVGLVMAPALMKRGKSTGENFETEYSLLKMGVTCVPLSLV